MDDEGRQVLPEGIPDIVEPEFFKKQDRQKVVKNIDKLKGYMTLEERIWWDAFLEYPDAALDEEQDWYLHEILPLENNEENAIRDNNNEICSPVHLLMQKEREVVDLSNTAKRNESCSHSRYQRVIAQKGWMSCV